MTGSGNCQLSKGAQDTYLYTPIFYNSCSFLFFLYKKKQPPIVEGPTLGSKLD